MNESTLQIQSKNEGIIHVCKIREKDAWSICDFVVANEERLKAFFPKTLAQNLTPELAAIFTNKKVREFNNKEEFLFTLKEGQSKKVIGLIYIKELAKVKRQGEFAYCIDYNFEGQGVVSQVVNELSEYAFKKLDLDRLQILVHKTNSGSIKVAENCNFTWQQTLIKEYKPSDREAMDMELYERFK